MSPPPPVLSPPPPPPPTCQACIGITRNSGGLTANDCNTLAAAVNTQYSMGVYLTSPFSCTAANIGPNTVRACATAFDATQANNLRTYFASNPATAATVSALFGLTCSVNPSTGAQLQDSIFTDCGSCYSPFTFLEHC